MKTWHNLIEVAMPRETVVVVKVATVVDEEMVAAAVVDHSAH